MKYGDSLPWWFKCIRFGPSGEELSAMFDETRPYAAALLKHVHVHPHHRQILNARWRRHPRTFEEMEEERIYLRAWQLLVSLWLQRLFPRIDLVQFDRPISSPPGPSGHVILWHPPSRARRRLADTLLQRGWPEEVELWIFTEFSSHPKMSWHSWRARRDRRVSTRARALLETLPFSKWNDPTAPAFEALPWAGRSIGAHLDDLFCGAIEKMPAPTARDLAAHLSHADPAVRAWAFQNVGRWAR